MSTPDVNAPPPRDLKEEQIQTAAGYAATAPRYYNLERQYQPAYGRLNLNVLRQNLLGFTEAGQHRPGTIELNRLQTDAQRANDRSWTEYNRAADVSDVAKYGPQATAALLRANPYLNSSLNNLSARTADTPILRTLNAQANQALASNGSLSPQDLRALNEQTRAGFAERGQLMGNQSLAADLLSRDAAVRQRQGAAQQFATGVQGLNQQQNDFVGRASQIFGTQLGDPFLAILGRSSGSGGGGGGGSSGVGVPQQIGTGAHLFDPNNPYASDLYNTNYNATAAANIATANNTAARNNAYIQAGAAIGGALLSDKRLKRDIKTVGKTESGIPIKTWTYRTDPEKRKWVGAIAQDIEKTHPGAVLTDEISGVKAVDYRKTDVPFGLANKRMNWATGKLMAA